MTDTLSVNTGAKSINFDKYKNAFKTQEQKSDSTSVFEGKNTVSLGTPKYELTNMEIAESGLKSAKNFIKGMFCDENGFSIKRTAMTVGVVAGLALAAPAVAALGASAGVVSAVAGTAKLAGLGLAGYMVYSGVKKADEGYSIYKYAKSETEAKESMEKITDGAVEVLAALPAAFGIKKGANAGKKMAAKNADAKKPAAPETPKPSTERNTNSGEVKPIEAEPIEIDLAPEVKPAEQTFEPTPRQPEFNNEFDFSVEEPKPIETPRAPEIKPASESRAPYEEFDFSVEEPKPIETAEQVKPVEPTPVEVKPIEEAPKAETKPVEEAKPAEEPKPAQPPKLDIPEPKELYDRNNLKDFVTAVLKKNPEGQDGIKLLLQAIKENNSPEFSVAQLESSILGADASAGLSGITTFVHNGKIILAVENHGTFSIKLKAVE